jgi:hypothetical protein
MLGRRVSRQSGAEDHRRHIRLKAPVPPQQKSSIHKILHLTHGFFTTGADIGVPSPVPQVGGGWNNREVNNGHYRLHNNL